MEELIKKVNKEKNFIYNEYVKLTLSFLAKHKLSSSDDVKYFINYWIPNKIRYANEDYILKLKYYIQDTFKDLIDDNFECDITELLRIYKVKNLILKSINDPVLDGNAKIIIFDNYIHKKNKKEDVATTYQKSKFIVKEIKDGGQIIFESLFKNKQYKCLIEYPIYKYLKVNDILSMTLKRKLFYVYWEIDELYLIFHK